MAATYRKYEIGCENNVKMLLQVSKFTKLLIRHMELNQSAIIFICIQTEPVSLADFQEVMNNT